MEVTNILEMKHMNENVPVIKIWLGQDGLQLINKFTHEEKCKTAKGLLFGTKQQIQTVTL